MKEKPAPPRRPAPEECCGKGCTPCVFDVYEEALARYNAELKKAREGDERAKAKPRKRS